MGGAGEEPATGIVAGITTNPGGSTLVTCVEDERLEFQDGMQVSLTCAVRPFTSVFPCVVMCTILWELTSAPLGKVPSLCYCFHWLSQ